MQLSSENSHSVLQIFDLDVHCAFLCTEETSRLSAVILVRMERVTRFPVKIPLNTIILMVFGGIVGLFLAGVGQVEVSEAVLVIVGRDRGLAVDLDKLAFALEAHRLAARG